MKKIIRTFLLCITSLYFANFIWDNLSIPNNISTVLLLGAILSVFELILKPILNMLLLPITILTLGIIRIFTNTLGLYLATYLVDSFVVKNISGSPSLGLYGFAASGLWAFVLISLTQTLWKSLVGYFFTKKVK